MGEDDINEVIKVAEILEERKIDYMVTGAQAVAVYGRPRASNDVDFVVNGIGRDQVVDTFKPYGYIVNPESWDYKHYIEMTAPCKVRIDFWLTPKEISWEVEQFSRKRRIDIGDRYICFISPEDLIIRKLWRYRKQRIHNDILDVKAIIFGTSDLDLDYLRKMTQVIRARSMFEELLKERVEEK